MASWYLESAQRWVLYRSACYLGKFGLTFGETIVPSASKAPGVSSLNVDLINTEDVDVVSNNLSFIQGKTLNHAFIGKRFEGVSTPTAFLKEVNAKLEIGGHLLIHQTIDQTKQAYRYTPEEMAGLVAGTGRYQAKASYLQNGQFLHIYKKLEGKTGIVSQPQVSKEKRACIVRYGALGDMIILTPLMRALTEDGFKVTLNITPYAAPVALYNPNFHNMVLQEREMIPNPELGAYWKEWQGDYEKYINLSESIEGKLLKVEGRPDFYTTKLWRIETGCKNYYDFTLRLGGYGHLNGKRGELFFSNAEERDWKKFIAPYRSKFVIVWAINGSSHHKVYAATEAVIEDWLLRHNDSIVITVGDRLSKMFELEHSRLIPMAGVWSIRQALIAAKYANCVIGPESMMLNAAGCFDTPKITFLSHSNHEALCKYWANDYCLTPSPTMAPCHPCFQLHYTRESCPLRQAVDNETGAILAEAPACALNAIHPTTVLDTLETVYNKHFNRTNVV